MRDGLIAICVLVVALAFGSHRVAAADAPEGPVRIVLVGDSTVCDYPPKYVTRGWGQFIGEFFKEGSVKVINLAASGRSTKTFISEGRWQQALDQHPRFILIQFGHNDSHNPSRPEATNAATDYRENLRRYVDDARAIGATPILVTPVVRRTFDANGKIVESPPGRTLTDYALAMKAVAAEKHVAVIDLHASSRALAEKLGPEVSAMMASGKRDATHFNEKGARAIAALVIEALPAAAPPLKAYLKTQ